MYPQDPRLLVYCSLNETIRVKSSDWRLQRRLKGLNDEGYIVAITTKTSPKKQVSHITVTITDKGRDYILALDPVDFPVAEWGTFPNDLREAQEHLKNTNSPVSETHHNSRKSSYAAMSLKNLKKSVDQLSPEELRELREYIEQREG